VPSELPSPAAALLLLGAALLLYLGLVALGRALHRSRGLRFGWTYHAFSAAAGLLGGLAVAPWEPSWRPQLLRHLGSAFFLFAVFPVVAVLNRVLWTRTQPDGQRVDAPPLLRDTIGLLVFAGVAVSVLQFGYGVKVPGLLAGSGLAAIILGLAMQDLLGNVLGGFALYWSKPFKMGDWLLFDGQHARVLELTWRSTRLVTSDGVLLEVPNGDLLKRPVVNFHQPGPRHAVRASIGLSYAVPPARACEVLRAAAASVPEVLAEPAPEVFVKEFADSAVTYEIRAWIEDHAVHMRVLSGIRSHCWYAVRRAGMEIPYPVVTLHRPTPPASAAAARAAAAAALHAHAVFGCLTGAEIEELVQQCPSVLFAPAELLVQQGAPGDSMFLLVRGRSEVRLLRNGSESVVTTLGPGDCLGEMSLLTGEARTATAVAAEEVEAVEITKAALTVLLSQNPNLLSRLGELLAQRQLANEGLAAAASPQPGERARGSVLRRLRSFFELTG